MFCAVLSVMATVCGTAHAASFNWQTNDTSLALRNGDKTVWQLVFDPKQPKTYFHPLATVDGKVLTALCPADHPWHRGLWWSWKFINGLNYWEEDKKTGRSDGVNELIGTEVTTNRDFSARVVLNFSYHPPEMPPALTETRTLVISKPEKNGNYRIDWSSVFMAADRPVELDRTPPHKGRVVWGGYAGLSLRFPKGLKGWKFLTSENATSAAQGSGKNAQWADFSGPISGIAVFDHPGNLRHPSPWYLNADLPFFSPALLYNKPLELAPKQEMKLRYRVLVHAGTAQKEELDKEWQSFTR